MHVHVKAKPEDNGRDHDGHGRDKSTPASVFFVPKLHHQLYTPTESLQSSPLTPLPSSFLLLLPSSLPYSSLSSLNLFSSSSLQATRSAGTLMSCTLGAPSTYRNDSFIPCTRLSTYAFEFRLSYFLNSLKGGKSVLSGVKWLRNGVCAGRFGSISSIPSAILVSYAHSRATFLGVYPPPPRMSKGRLKDLTNLTQAPWALMLRLKQPSRSPPRESAPH